MLTTYFIKIFQKVINNITLRLIEVDVNMFDSIDWIFMLIMGLIAYIVYEIMEKYVKLPTWLKVLITIIILCVIGYVAGIISVIIR